MKAWRRLQSFLTALFQRTRFEREMTAELEHHVAERTEDLVARGALPGDAARRAMQELGDPLRWKEAGREARGLRLVDDLRTDAIYGVRWLRRSPGFAVAALASLALGIGANVAVFNLLDDVMVRALPVDRPEELVLFGAVEGASDPSHTFSYRALQFFREQSRTLAAIAASASIRVSVERDGQMLPTAAAQVVSGNYYTLLGVPAVLGRVLQASDDGAPGTGNVAVLDHALLAGRLRTQSRNRRASPDVERSALYNRGRLGS